MKVAVVSDTHGCLSMLDRCIKLAGQVDVWCHLGDLTSDAEALMSRTNAKVYAVRGNCDYFGGSAQRYESEAVVELGGARILMMHGHTHGGRSPSFALLEIENGDVRAEIITM